MEQWKNILCIRTDNMGDLLMNIPAFRALKESFHCKLTVLTSPLSQAAVDYIDELDDCIVYNAPWNRMDVCSEDTLNLISVLREGDFDGCIIFTVYSQNPLPAALLALLSGIPKRLAYCRENPYGLLTHWVPDPEPYFFIQHQVERDLALVGSIGAMASHKRLHLRHGESEWNEVKKKLSEKNFNWADKWMILHPGVSEAKREYPPEGWIRAAKLLLIEPGFQLVLTGTEQERNKSDRICSGVGKQIFNLCGELTFGEFISLIKHASLVVSVNTATCHVAAAMNTPVVVLYALTNPQHTPWQVATEVLTFHVPDQLQSKNQVVRFVHDFLLKNMEESASPENIQLAATELLYSRSSEVESRPKISNR